MQPVIGVEILSASGQGPLPLGCAMLRDLLTFVFAWYNLPFTVLFGMGILLASLQLIGLGGQ